MEWWLIPRLPPPGATSWTLLLAAAWRADENRRKVVLEADPDGGVLGVRYGVGVDPGAISLASAARRSRSAGFEIDDIDLRASPRPLEHHPERPLPNGVCQQLDLGGDTLL